MKEKGFTFILFRPIGRLTWRVVFNYSFLFRINDMNLHLRLELIPATAKLLRLEENNPPALALFLNAAMPADWPPEEVRDVLGFFADQMDAGVTGEGWGIYYWIARFGTDEPAVLVGSGGFMSKPNGGTVEIGYGTLTQFQGRGYATEVVTALTAWALSQPDVSVVFADALPGNAASVRVLQKAGFTEAGPGAEEGTRRFEAATPNLDTVSG